jgi:hypothetical protein
MRHFGGGRRPLGSAGASLPRRGPAQAEGRLAPQARAGVGAAPPAVVGAVIDLGDCLDLTTLVGLDMLRSAYESLAATFDEAGEPLPVNQDRVRPQLDCAVIERLHAIYEEQGGSSTASAGVFVEGEPVYPGSGVDTKTHVQMTVRNPNCVKGVFRVPESHVQPWSPPGRAGEEDGVRRGTKEGRRSAPRS